MKIIKNGTLVTSSKVFKADLLIENESIKAIGHGFDESSCEIIDAKDCLVFPGLVDVHTHFDLDVGSGIKSVDDFSIGSKSAACGGVCTIVDHMAFGPKNCPLTYQPKIYHEKTKGKTFVDYSFHGTIQHVNDEILAQMQELKNEGITSFKLYTTYGYKLAQSEILAVLKRAKELDVIVAVHCEDDEMLSFAKNELIKNGKTSPNYHGASRPSLCEENAIKNLINLSRLADFSKPYVVHLSTIEGLEALKKARKKQNIFVETCTQYLIFDESFYKKDDPLKFTMSPPLRTTKDINALWKGIKDGVIDIIATDHCPFNLNKEKQLGKDDFTKCPGGVPGVEERLGVIYTQGVAKGRISLEKFVEVMCENPARIYGCKNKGFLLPGFDADIVIYDPKVRHVLNKSELHGAVDYSLYEGFKIQGEIKKVFLRGEMIVKNNTFLSDKPKGRFIHRN